MMNKVLHIVQLPNEEATCTLYSTLVHHDMPCDPKLVSSAIPIFPFYLFHLLV